MRCGKESPNRSPRRPSQQLVWNCRAKSSLKIAGGACRVRTTLLCAIRNIPRHREAGVGDVFQVSIRRDRLERQNIDDFESREGDLTLAWQSKTFTVFQRSQSREIVHDDR